MQSMNAGQLDFQQLRSLLRRRADDPAVSDAIEGDTASIERNAYLGFVESKRAGIAVLFQEEPWVVPPAEVTDPAALRVSGFHFYREGDDGYSQYKGQLPNAVAIGDLEVEIIRKMGEPSATGGGGWSTMLKQPIQRWLRYLLDDDILQFQLDTDSRVDLD